MENRMYFVNENGSRNSAQYPFIRYTTSIQYRYADELCVLLIFRDRQKEEEKERERGKKQAHSTEITVEKQERSWRLSIYWELSVHCKRINENFSFFRNWQTMGPSISHSAHANIKWKTGPKTQRFCCINLNDKKSNAFSVFVSETWFKWENKKKKKKQKNKDKNRNRSVMSFLYKEKKIIWSISESEILISANKKVPF